MRLEVVASLNDIPLKNWQSLMASKKDEEITEEQTIATLLGVDIDVLRRLKSSSVSKLSEHLKSLFNRQYNLTRIFNLDGKEFGFIPNLDQASYGEIQDIEDFISDPANMHRAMGVMYRPVTLSKGSGPKRKYRIEDYNPGKYDDIMKEAPLDVALGAQVFFCRLTADLVSSIPNYMREGMHLIKDSETFQKNGADIISSIRLLEEISQEWRRQADRISMPV